ncbi:hypothetical protein V6N11_019123 [Hibiscus sabdariffa]|uniref:Uncharacterized protein n=1 Tax=Hibiscus sabdariffa TaxID=183260 RepID=A0ABR2R1I2_9ROSI
MLSVAWDSQKRVGFGHFRYMLESYNGKKRTNLQSPYTHAMRVCKTFMSESKFDIVRPLNMQEETPPPMITFSVETGNSVRYLRLCLLTGI